MLLNWANANYMRTTNFPTKPHAIIALNKSDHSTPEHSWDEVTATASLLKSANAQIDKNSTFIKYVDMWKASNTRIRDMDDLLRRYYSTVKVVRLPDKCRLQRMHQQRQALYEVIQKCCDDTMDVEKDRNMLPDVEEFGLYLSLAFDHFSESLDVPFDYVEASLKHQPPPLTFIDSMLVFIRMIAQEAKPAHDSNPQLQATEVLFDLLTPFVASCLMLDSSRKQHIGNVHTLASYLHC